MLLRLLRFLLFALGCAAFGVVVTALGLFWYVLRHGPQPQVWHTAQLQQEFTASREAQVAGIDDYRRLEDALFAELETEVYDRVPGRQRLSFNRYSAGSRSDPRTWPRDWNRSYELDAPGEWGAALLLHGLTDSPYSLRTIGERLQALGLDVVGLRLPGHGTAPSGLLSVEVEDMQAAVRVAMRDLRRRLGPGRPILIVGYSNGAALAVDYSMAVLDGADLPRPAGLVLLSPAIEVSRLATLARVRLGLSSVPGFARAAWQTIEPEFDPFKYVSFSFHAAGETDRLTRRIRAEVERRSREAPIRGFPTTLVFLSTVDATVRADGVVDALLEHLAPEGHELVLFDVNRLSAARQLLVDDPGPLTRRLLGQPQRSYALSVITNVHDGTLQVQELRAPAGSGRPRAAPLDLYWPDRVFSLSHVALPFAREDPLYGDAAAPDPGHVQLGQVEARGESGVLTLPAWVLTRQRSNPFFGYLAGRVERFALALRPATAP